MWTSGPRHSACPAFRRANGTPSPGLLRHTRAAAPPARRTRPPSARRSARQRTPPPARPAESRPSRADDLTSYQPDAPGVVVTRSAAAPPRADSALGDSQVTPKQELRFDPAAAGDRLGSVPPPLRGERSEAGSRAGRHALSEVKMVKSAVFEGEVRVSREGFVVPARLGGAFAEGIPDRGVPGKGRGGTLATIGDDWVRSFDHGRAVRRNNHLQVEKEARRAQKMAAEQERILRVEREMEEREARMKQAIAEREERKRREHEERIGRIREQRDAREQRLAGQQMSHAERERLRMWRWQQREREAAEREREEDERARAHLEGRRRRANAQSDWGDINSFEQRYLLQREERGQRAGGAGGPGGPGGAAPARGGEPQRARAPVSKAGRRLMQEQRRRREEEERERLQKAELLHRRQKYGNVVREVFRPTVDEGKARELARLREQIDRNKAAAQRKKAEGGERPGHYSVREIFADAVAERDERRRHRRTRRPLEEGLPEDDDEEYDLTAAKFSRGKSRGQHGMDDPNWGLVAGPVEAGGGGDRDGVVPDVWRGDGAATPPSPRSPREAGGPWGGGKRGPSKRPSGQALPAPPDTPPPDPNAEDLDFLRKSRAGNLGGTGAGAGAGEGFEEDEVLMRSAGERQ